jgi:D-glycero-beta-D-manno-heptose 1-phosphate adenylyltransferase
MPDQITNKIYTLPDLLRQVKIWRLQSKKIVFTNGCFDILHLGHVKYLAEAASLGNILIIGLNSDASVKKLNKGANRPIQDEISRAAILASLQFTDAVILFDNDTPYELIKAIMPDILVKGGDWKPEQIIGHDLVIPNGGMVKSLNFTEGYSTTKIEKRIKED